jgi:hypothetical protein
MKPPAGLVDESHPGQVKPHSGWVEHEIHELVNAPLSKSAATSDHRPISLAVTIDV